MQHWFCNSYRAIKPGAIAPGFLCLQRRQGQWFTNQIALQIVHAESQQHLALFSRFHIFNHHTKRFRFGHVANGLHDHRIHAVGADIFHEAAIDLNDIGLQPLQALKVGIAGTKVINSNAEAVIPQLLDIVDAASRVRESLFLGDLNDDILRRNGVAFKSAMISAAISFCISVSGIRLTENRVPARSDGWLRIHFSNFSTTFRSNRWLRLN